MDQLKDSRHAGLQKALASDLVWTTLKPLLLLHMCHTTIRTVLALAAINDLELCSVDISHAFTNSDVDAEIYIKQLEGFEQGESKYVCKLNKSLYELKQSPRLWDEKLAQVLFEMGFAKTYSDASLFIYDRDRMILPLPLNQRLHWTHLLLNCKSISH